jgi:hypothetical protein
MFVNPFKSHHVDDFPGVHVPLDDTTHRGSISTHQRASLASSEKATKDDEPADALRRPDSNASSGVVNHGMTVAALKAEIEADVAASDSDTPYDREFVLMSEERNWFSDQPQANQRLSIKLCKIWVWAGTSGNSLLFAAGVGWQITCGFRYAPYTHVQSTGLTNR